MKRTSSHLISILLSLLILTSACQPAEPTASPLTGKLSELRGMVKGKKASEDQFKPVVAGSILEVSDQVQTGEDGHVRIDLSTGTIVRVVPSTLFTLVSNEETSGGLVTKLKLELGRIFIILNGGSMEVETPSGVASVLGSYMMVEVDPLTLDVVITCLEGDCSASNPAGALDFTEGQKVTLFHFDPATGQYRPPQLEDMNDEDFQEWLDENPEAAEILRQVLANRQNSQPIEPPALVTVTDVPATEVPATVIACLNIINPPNESSLPHNGPVTFLWESQEGASQYTVTFHYPDGQSVPFNTAATELTRFLDTIPDGGTYQWEVTALDGSGNVICTTQGFSFTKPSSHLEDVAGPTKPPEEPQLCTEGQWENPNAPCYCGGNNNEQLPPYCGGGY